MQFNLVALVAVLAATASAQDLSGLPKCARPCFTDNFSKSGCKSKTNFKCLCKSEPYINAVEGCVATSCGADAISKSLTWAQNKCKKAGAPLPGS